jgi:sterol desaturase/sphingolipid hydroxylase (fatty acid hydroxylase superfamily)
MQSEQIETMSFVAIAGVFSLFESLRPYRQDGPRARLLDLLGGGVGLLAVVLSRAALKALFAKCGLGSGVALLDLGALPAPLKLVLTLLGIDFCLYWIHRAMHTPTFWPTHILHHTIESMTWLAGLRTSAVHAFCFTLPQVVIPFYVFGATEIEGGMAISGIIFAQIFIHSNINVGLGFVGQWILVTPNTHRIHHGYSVPRDRNFGSLFIIWDRLFGTWLPPSQVDHGYRLGVGKDSAVQARRLQTLLGI